MRTNKRIIVSAFILAAVLVFAIFSLTGSSGLPSYALKSDQVKQAYTFATEHPNEFTGINCHCGCMNSLDHKDLEDCFINDNGGYNEHASFCSECINDANRAIKLVNEGKTKAEINNIIGVSYA